MPIDNQPTLIDFLGALIVSVISGVISISRRVVNGTPVSMLWVVSEFLTAILTGYLMYTAYPHIAEDVPKWFTLPIAVAAAAHMGGKLFQEVENVLVKNYVAFLDRRKP